MGRTCIAAVATIAAASALTALAPASHAQSTVSVESIFGMPSLSVQGDNGQDWIRVFESGSGELVVWDGSTTSSAQVSAGAGCVETTFMNQGTQRHGVKCPNQPLLLLSLAGGDDRSSIDGQIDSDAWIFGGAGNDQLTGGASHDLLFGGEGNDTLTGGKGNDSLVGEAGADALDGGTGADNFDGGPGYDVANYSARTIGVTVTQDDVANDGNPSEDGGADNVRSNIEALFGGSGQDELWGADTFQDGQSLAAIFGSGGSDEIHPGKRKEEIWADGFTATPGGSDEVSYETRNEKLLFIADDQPNDGAQDSGGAPQELDNVHAEAAIGSQDYGFERIRLGKGGDSYYGHGALEIPLGQLPDNLTPDKRVEVNGGPGNDQLYPGTIAEDLKGGAGGQDLVSYIFRHPRENGITRVGMSLDGEANDGENLDAAKELGTEAVLAFFLPLAVRRLVPWRLVVRANEVTIRYENGAYVRAVKDEVRLILSNSVQGRDPFSEHTGLDAIEKLDDFIDRIANTPPPPGMEEEVQSLIDALTEVLDRWEFNPPGANGGGPLQALFVLPLAFEEYGGELDNISDDVERLQGSDNQGISPGRIADDIIQGNDDDNVVIGSPGPDTVVGNGGNDILEGDTGGSVSHDTILGGSGADLVNGGPGADTLTGGSGPDILLANGGSADGDGWPDTVMCGLDGWSALEWLFPFPPGQPPEIDIPDGSLDTVSWSALDFTGLGLDCRIDAGIGSVVQSPPTAKAKLSQGKLVVTAETGKQNELQITHQAAQNRFEISDAAGKVLNDGGCTTQGDLAYCPAAGVNSVEVDAKDLDDSVDLSLPASRSSSLFGGSGNDTIRGGSGNDTIDGGPGQDTLDGRSGADTVSYLTRSVGVYAYLDEAGSSGNGEPGENDSLLGFESVFGGSGSDELLGNTQNNVLVGGQGNDSFQGGPGNDILWDDHGQDELRGGLGQDWLIAGRGNDSLDGGPGADSLQGGTGTDSASYASRAIGVYVYLDEAGSSGNGEPGENDSLAGDIENVTGGSGPDELLGNTLANVITGGPGNDRLLGGPGEDIVFGEAGDDELRGGAGKNWLYAGSGADTIYAKNSVKDHTVDCGAQSDRAQVDASGSVFDPLIGCEELF